MSKHYGKWDAEPELEQADLAEMQAELAEIAERKRIEAGAELYYLEQK